MILAMLLGLVAGIAQPQSVVQGAAALTVTPITWNVVGLDSNNVNVGPNHFPVGARVCNTGDAAATNVKSAFNWTSANGAINIRPGSLTGYTADGINLNPTQCHDFYYEIEITRNASSYDQTRRFTISATADGGISGLSPTPREIYVEHLISQSRNSTIDVKLNGESIPPGGTMALLVGNTYTIELVGSTATNGYEQIENFINFPNNIFQINSVVTTYTAPSAGTTKDTLYGDGCRWENDPNSPNYRSCLGTGKYGGDITVTYNVTIISGAGTNQNLNSLIYDFSGSSYHYNADYSVQGRIAAIIDPNNVTFTKSFSPNPVSINGTTALTFTLTNPNPGRISGYNFIDSLPAGLVIANPADATTISCGTPTLVANPGASTITFSNGTLSANSNCTIKVSVTPSVTGPLINTTDHLFLNSIDTGKFAQATLTVNTAPTVPPLPTTCTNSVVLASWTMPVSGQGSGGPPPPYTTIASDVSSAVASFTTQFGQQTIESAGNPANSWGGTAPTAASNGDGWNETANSMLNYFQFVADTSNYGGAFIVFDINPSGNGWDSPNSQVFINTRADGGAFSGFTPVPTAAKGNWTNITATAASTGSATTTFRIGVNGGGNKKPNALLLLDNIIIRGCPRLAPPRIIKVFSPDPIAMNEVTTLTFTLTNPNASNALNGVTFTDTLPSGLQVAATPSAVTTCGGTPTWAPAAGATSLYLWESRWWDTIPSQRFLHC